MGIEISGTGNRPPLEASESGKSTTTSATNGTARSGSTLRPPSGGDRLDLSDQAAQLKALEAEIATLPVVDTQRVQDVQRTIATGAFQVEPAQVADKLLSFEAVLAQG